MLCCFLSYKMFLICNKELRLLKIYNHGFTSGNFRIRHELKLLALIFFLAQCALVNAQSSLTTFQEV